MDRTRKLKWFCGICLLAGGGAIFAIWVTIVRPVHSIKPESCLIIQYDIEPTEQGLQVLPKSFAINVARVISGRLELGVVPVGKKRIEVRIPVKDDKPIVTLGSVNEKLKPLMGRLEFCIAPYAPDKVDNSCITRQECEQYVKDFQKKAPPYGSQKDKRFKWVPIYRDTVVVSNLVLANVDNKRYVLLSNEPSGRVSVSNFMAFPSRDKNNNPAVLCKFDTRGANRMAALTIANKGRILAIILGGDVYSTPRIKDTITNECLISGDLTKEEVTELVIMLEQAAMPFRITFPPVVVQRK